jgi:predicted RNase H-like HicB family nuclease
MERVVRIHVQRLPEGVYLATSDDVPGLVAQGRTVVETLDIARDVACKLLEAQAQSPAPLRLLEVDESFDYPRIVTL